MNVPPDSNWFKFSLITLMLYKSWEQFEDSFTKWQPHICICALLQGTYIKPTKPDIFGPTLLTPLPYSCYYAICPAKSVVVLENKFTCNWTQCIFISVIKIQNIRPLTIQYIWLHGYAVSQLLLHLSHNFIHGQSIAICIARHCIVVDVYILYAVLLYIKMNVEVYILFRVWTMHYTLVDIVLLLIVSIFYAFYCTLDEYFA
jgi:hypothetical protein